MNKSFKLSAIVVAAVLAFASSAFAVNPGSATYSASAASSGRISTQAATHASVNGAGTSLSHADTQAGSYSTESVIATPHSIGINGSVSGSVDAQAYNISTGSGTGSASAGGLSDASMNGSARLTVPSMGYVRGVASLDGGMGNAVRNGVDAHVVAGKSKDGFAGGTYDGTVAFSGTIEGVHSSQTANGEAYSGAVDFGRHGPDGQGAATRTANTGVQADVSGSFHNLSNHTHGEIEMNP